MLNPLEIRAGRVARSLLERGWDWNLFDVVLGASAGPRWLALSGLDPVLFQHLGQGRTRPLHLLGSSSGAWRFLAYCQADPARALSRLEEAYIEADWNHKRSLDEIRGSAQGILDAYLGEKKSQERVLRQEPFRLHVVTSHCRGPLASERRWAQSLGLVAVALLAGVHRRAAGSLCQRWLFSDPRDPLPALLDDIATRRIALTPSNLPPVILASGAIPLVLPGVRGLSETGCLRDGGLVDYHFHHVRLKAPGLILYPHFANTMWPGWLDAPRWRHRLSDEVTSRLVVICPTAEWIAALPGSALPDRLDGISMAPEERRRRWWEVARRSQALGDALEATVRSSRVLDLG